jgi:membrane associated rhomboid family serine protease/Zn-finger nucleic acid-binding protein
VFTCPNDQLVLIRASPRRGVFWTCSSCGGRAVGLGQLRETVDPGLVTDLWTRARDGNATTDRPCPICAQPMALVSLDRNGTGPAVDVCRTCYVVWFDPQEFEVLQPIVEPEPVPERPIPDQAAEILAIAASEAIKERARRDSGREPPEGSWKYLPALMGMPVEYEQPLLSRVPLMTWTLVGFIVAFSIRAFFNLEVAVLEYGLIPAQAGRAGGLTFITSFLLHGGLLHLIGNMYFLIMFGDNVEDYLGKVRYALLIIGAAFVGDLAHIALDPRSTIPVIGASGGISGILAYYVLRFPKARLGILFRFFLYFRWIQMPAYAWGLLWVAFQLVGALQQVSGASNVSALAHLGGAAVGVAFWWATHGR